MINYKTSANCFRNITRNSLGFVFSKLPRTVKGTSRSLTVFSFHDISDTPSKFTEKHGLCVSLNTFQFQCQWIKSNFNVVHPVDLVSGTELPLNAAMISFDDGFLGSFENGLSILEKLNLPSILFLNMGSISKKTPLISAVACYLEQSNPSFLDYAKKIGLRQPFHLTLSPSILSKFQDEYGCIDFNSVTQYQGHFADLEIVKKWDLKPLVCYGNHLYEHWNAIPLSEDEFEDQYEKNEKALKKLRSWVRLFAFTNGQPHTCFTGKNVNFLKEKGTAKAFSNFKGVNRNYKTDFLLGRVSFGPNDDNSSRLWFRVARAVTQFSSDL